MPARTDLTISKRTVDALSVEGREAVFWDRELPGFGVRVYPSGRKVYVVQSRGPKGLKRVTVGRHGVISADVARRRAAMILTRIKAGGGPVPKPLSRAGDGRTVGDFAERYFREHLDVRCKPGTARIRRYVIGRHILPRFGNLPVSAIRREDVATLHYELRKAPTVANDAVSALSHMLNRAEAWGLAPPGGNPCRFVAKYKSRKRERFLTHEEFRRLGRVLSAMETQGRVPAPAAAALRLLMLTGCRVYEILTLRWEDVHLEASEVRLRDSKTGPRVVPLSPAAARVLAGLPRAADNPWVIAGRKAGSRLNRLYRQ